MANDRVLKPIILETKQELLMALKSGGIKSSKYNLLNDDQKLFVELVCFAGYTPEEAIRAIVPGTKMAKALANRMALDPTVCETIDELTVAKNKKFRSMVTDARELALEKIKYIMMTTDDDALAASCAKIIMDKGEGAMRDSDNREEPVGAVKFQISVENVYAGGSHPKSDKSEPVIIEIDDDQIDSEVAKLREEKEDLKREIENDKIKNKKAMENINPETGLPYVLKYEGVDYYNDND